MRHILAVLLAIAVVAYSAPTVTNDCNLNDIGIAWYGLSLSHFNFLILLFTNLCNTGGVFTLADNVTIEMVACMFYYKLILLTPFSKYLEPLLCSKT